jgi:mycofactocin system transcriptional regulator
MTGRANHITVAAIERVALELFARNGFEATTVEDIAAAAGISRRTFFRYFRSKNDVPWGDWPRLLDELDDVLTAAPDDMAIFEVIAAATARVNRLPTDGRRAHRERMELILHTPALQAHSSLRYAEWRAVVARFAARRRGEPVDGLGPQLIGHLALAGGQAAYEEWLRDDSSDLDEVVHRTFAMIAVVARAPCVGSAAER